jgi:hypothetical protein
MRIPNWWPCYLHRSSRNFPMRSPRRSGRGDNATMGERLTDGSAREVDAGAVITRLASKPRASKAARLGG